MSADDRLRLAGLGLHPGRTRKLLGQWGNASAVLRAVRLGQIDVSAGVRSRLEWDVASAVEAAGASVVYSEQLPAMLRELPDHPDLLFVRGAPLPARPGVAIVGSRASTRYGLEAARRFGAAVAAQGWPVLSGLARGVDGAAHQGCVDVGGTAVAILGCGVDVSYPPEHGPLADRVLEGGGTVVSEYAPGAPPESWRFPPRNRLISGLAGVVVVVEAGIKGGALITAARALEQGRLVLALPGDLDRPTSQGCNLLIRDGAHPVLGVDDLITSLTFALGPPPQSLVAAGDPIIELVERGPQTVDGIVQAIGCSVPEVLRRIAVLEASGLIVIDGGNIRAAGGSG